jgi:hypothetical protein
MSEDPSIRWTSIAFILDRLPNRNGAKTFQVKVAAIDKSLLFIRRNLDRYNDECLTRACSGLQSRRQNNDRPLNVITIIRFAELTSGQLS